MRQLWTRMCRNRLTFFGTLAALLVLATIFGLVTRAPAKRALAPPARPAAVSRPAPAPASPPPATTTTTLSALPPADAAPLPARAVDVAERFVTAWADTTRTPAAWRAAVDALTTSQLAAGFASTDLASLPSDVHVTDVQTSTGDTGGGQVVVNTTQGTMVVIVVHQDGRWLVGDIQ